MSFFSRSWHHILFFSLLFVTVAFFFKNAFSIRFVLDDYFFLIIGQAHTLQEFIGFFSPLKEYFYRPLSTETLFFFINATGQNLMFAHSLSFLFYFLGLFFLYKVTYRLTNNKILSCLFVFMYAIHFTHVFQLYMMNTFQEIALFAFLTISFYFYLLKRFYISILFFVFALMSKESAVVYPAFLFLFTLYHAGMKDYKNYKLYIKPVLFGIVSVIFFIIFRYGASHVATIDIYEIHLSPKLIINNIQWYILWSLGLPNFLPNFTRSIFSIPTNDFWNLFNFQDYRIYFQSIMAFYGLFLLTGIIYFIQYPRKLYPFIINNIFLILCFLIFVAPTLPIIHRWMVRLTIPLLFIVMIEAAFIYLAYSSGKILRVLSICLLIAYISLQYTGITVHESSSLISMESTISTNAGNILARNREEIVKRGKIYFDDTNTNELSGSKKLKLSLHNQDFLAYFLPNEKIVALYAFEHKNPPQDAFIIRSYDVVNGK